MTYMQTQNEPRGWAGRAVFPEILERWREATRQGLALDFWTGDIVLPGCLFLKDPGHVKLYDQYRERLEAAK
jgi:hypothetical protein